MSASGAPSRVVPRLWRPLAPGGFLLGVLLLTSVACKAPPRSPSCEIAAFLCRSVPCDDGGVSTVDNCPQLGLTCESARDTCPRRAEVAACLDSLAGATLTCPDADACFTRAGCRWVGVLPNDGGAPAPDAGLEQDAGFIPDAGLMPDAGN